MNNRFSGYDFPSEYRAIYHPQGGFLHCEQCVVAHVDAAHSYGATIRARESVSGWEADETGIRIQTDRDKYEADSMVVTAGAWTGQLLPSLSNFLTPERQVLGWFQPNNPTRFIPENFPVFVCSVEEGHYYGFPSYQVPGFKLGKFNHRQESGSPAELARDPDKKDEQILREFVERYFPEGHGPTMRLSTCMFTNTPDGNFLLDTHPDHQNIIIGAGFSGHGFKFATVIGEILADLASDNEAELPTESFRISRFS